MIRLFFVVTMLCLTLAGCGDVEWFPDPKVIPDTTSGTLNVSPFSFPPKTNVVAGEVQTSDPVTISMTGGPAKISVSGGSYKIGTGAFTTDDGTINNGDQVTVQHTHTAAAVEVVTTLTIGEESATFVSTTAAATSNVTQFSIAPKTNYVLNTAVVSDPFTVAIAGTAPAAISVVGGEYSINSSDSAAFTSTAGTVSNSAQIRVRHTPTAVGQKVTTLTIGSKSATFISTTLTVEPFTFESETNVAANTLIASNVVTLKIGGGNAPISVTTENSAEYSINGGDFVNDARTVKNNDQVQVRHRSSSLTGSEHINTTLTVGNRTATFTSVTSP